MSADFYGPGMQRQSDRFGRTLAAGALVLLAGLALSLLAGGSTSIVKRKIPAPDMPWQANGIRYLAVAADGTWTIQRAGYLDRQRQLKFTYDGQLKTQRDDTLPVGVTDTSGGFDAGPRTTAAGSVITVKPSKDYYKWLKSLRKGGDPLFLNPLPDPAEDAGAAPGTSATLQEWVPLLQRIDQPADVALPRAPETGVVIWLNPTSKLAIFSLLPGHWYYNDMADCAAFKDGRLWLTMDRQRNLYRLRVDEPAGAPPALTIEAAAPIKLPDLAERAGRLGLDEQKGQLFLARPDGKRFWFDPESLELLSADRLPGNWDTEYAEMDFQFGEHNGWLGQPLSQPQYERIMRSAMVVFLACLLGLALLWRPQWKSTSAATTADSNSSPDSANT